MTTQRPRVCYVCGATFPTAPERSAHLAETHPGFRIAWQGRDPVVIDPEGSRRVVTKAETARAVRAAQRSARPAAKPKVRRTVESLTPEPGAEPGAEPGPAPDDRRRPFVSQPTVRLTPEYRSASMRETVSEAFTLDMLATILRDLSIAISEADGAGEEGHLSRIQAVQLANLLYDVTVDTIVSRFAGNVGRFKMALAALLILASKGRVHARAIAAKVTARRAARGAEAVTAEAIEREAAEHPPVDPYTAALASGDPIAILAARQQADTGRRDD